MQKDVPNRLDELAAAFEESFDQSWLPADMLERYSPVECLAESSGCTTLLLSSRVGDEKCIAKCYSKSVIKTPVSETEILPMISHKGLPGYIGRYENEHTVCVLRRYIEGIAFSRIVRTRRFSSEETVSFALRLCDILCYLHNLPLPVLHRDIKPENIVVDEAENVYLIDFGISRIVRDAEKKDTSIAATAAYAPPEQYGFLPTDARSDIYALGVVMNEMITGSTELSGNIPDKGLRRIIRKCTAFSPADRYPNAERLRKDLKNWRHRVLRGVGGGLLAAAGLVLAVMLTAAAGRMISESMKNDTLLTGSNPDEELSWTFDTESRCLTVSGSGELTDELFDSADGIDPSQVTELIIEDGIADMESSLCGKLYNVRHVTLPYDMKGRIDEDFAHMYKLESVALSASPGTGVGWRYNFRTGTLEITHDGIGSGIVDSETLWHDVESIDSDRIKHVVVGEGITELGFNVLWYHLSMQRLDLPSTIEIIDSSNFADTPSLTKVSVHEANEYFCVVDGMLFGYDERMQPSTGTDKLYFVPRDHDGTLYVPQGTTVLESFSCSNCRSLTKIVLPESLYSIEKSAFAGDSALEEFSLPDNSVFAFDNGVLFSARDVIIDGSMYSEMTIVCAVSNISGHYIVPEEYDRVFIKGGAFSGCTALEEITLTDNVLHIGDGAFYGCTALERVNLPVDISDSFGRWQEDYAECYFGYGAFERSGVTSVRVPRGVTEISEYCFYNCRDLREAIIPETVGQIYDNSFEGCASLEKIEYDG